MLTPGNAKLGTDLIWSFSVPSGGKECVGLSKVCREACYARRTEQYRPKAAARYRRNLALSKTKGFVRRVRAFLIAHHVRVVRIHTGGEFATPRYVRKWRAIIRRSPRVQFFTYTRAWRVPAIRMELERLAELSNLQLWYSTDQETGLPDHVPNHIRLAWLMVGEDDLPAGRVDLIFRVRALRRVPLAEWNGVPVCPAESGVPGPKTTCDHCRMCWKPPPAKCQSAAIPSLRLSLPLIVRKESDADPLHPASSGTAVRS
jgi:hypothetical protein